MVTSVHIIFIFIKYFIYLSEREKMSKQAGGGVEGKGKNPKQTAC